ncbi:hypothetical protein JT358_15530 [Micrococcales bacterium 31B]|nr:hypothetical protein [Micrococcales bacterium 31B]
MTLHLDQISADFYAVRGLDDDCEWARTAYARLVLDGLDTDDAAVGLAAPPSSLRAAAVARDGSSPEHLLGAATEWAKQALPDLRASSDLRAPLERPAGLLRARVTSDLACPWW